MGDGSEAAALSRFRARFELQSTAQQPSEVGFAFVFDTRRAADPCVRGWRLPMKTVWSITLTIHPDSWKSVTSHPRFEVLGAI
jgi:hypothetical protein